MCARACTLNGFYCAAAGLVVCRCASRFRDNNMKTYIYIDMTTQSQTHHEHRNVRPHYRVLVIRRKRARAWRFRHGLMRSQLCAVSQSKFDNVFFGLFRACALISPIGVNGQPYVHLRNHRFNVPHRRHCGGDDHKSVTRRRNKGSCAWTRATCD